MGDPFAVSVAAHLLGLAALVLVTLGWHRERAISRQRRRDRDAALRRARKIERRMALREAVRR